jgi:protein-glutamine gamma-glutamyltransferase
VISPEEFELKMRNSIVESAIALNASGVSFATFKNSRCNEHLWSHSENGGFRLRSGVLPSDGIRDIFRNGRLYAFECATAMVIILYKAAIDTINEETFNVHFKDLFLWDWNYNSNLRIISNYNIQYASPGDVLYFENPDHAPESPEWQGLNVIKLGEDLYYGLGIGIGTLGKMIFLLNKIRRPWSMTSAYLSELVVHPDFEYLRNLSPRGDHLVVPYKHLENSIVARIGTNNYIYRN